MKIIATPKSRAGHTSAILNCSRRGVVSRKSDFDLKKNIAVRGCAKASITRLKNSFDKEALLNSELEFVLVKRDRLISAFSEYDLGANTRKIRPLGRERRRHLLVSTLSSRCVCQHLAIKKVTRHQSRSQRRVRAKSNYLTWSYQPSPVTTLRVY